MASATSPPTVICVFCGSSPGSSDVHLKAARELAQVLHDSNISLVYGGGTTGLMGEVARTLVSLSGPESVHGVIPKALVEYERVPNPLDIAQKASENTSLQDGALGPYGRTSVVPDMHTRKRRMAEAVMAGGPGSGFIALSGGYGTIEELMEMVTWNQLGIHDRGVVVLNVDGFYDGVVGWVKTATEAGFVKGGNADIMVEAKTAGDAVKALREYKVSAGRFGLDWSKS
ncbi:hypothetical protein B0O99DRAFT_520518 [Bisporella sp. PMI_857]|nr:hypothetical protein B0O99DRAFT_520518 [Bisporella sp. PMI_857]